MGSYCFVEAEEIEGLPHVWRERRRHVGHAARGRLAEARPRHPHAIFDAIFPDKKARRADLHPRARRSAAARVAIDEAENRCVESVRQFPVWRVPAFGEHDHLGARHARNDMAHLRRRRVEVRGACEEQERDQAIGSGSPGGSGISKTLSVIDTSM